MRALITGAAGLIGSHVSLSLARDGWDVTGIDNDSRATFFGSAGSTHATVAQLVRQSRYKHIAHDVADHDMMARLVGELEPQLIVHAAAQPSHDTAARIPFLDARTNVLGTLSVLEAIRSSPRCARETLMVHLSTNKVYGDNPNRIAMQELQTRYDYADKRDGIDESMPVTNGIHSLFGVSKLAADAYVIEYGKNFGIQTVSLRCGCLTGPAHASVEAHGFMSYIVKCALRGTPYKIYGYGGKQVRDQLHAADVVRLIKRLLEQRPPAGSAFNVGGGRKNSISILESIDAIEYITSKRLVAEYVDAPRVGDHICYITDNAAITSFTGWRPTLCLDTIINDIAEGITER
jgi:CDP-paratose 2-epimerase